MGDFTGTILTNRGRNLIAKAQTGVTLNFTRIGLGDGVWPQGTDPATLTALVNEKKSISIQSLQVTGDGTSRLRFVLTNTGLTAGFFIREIGIFANDPDSGEILYAVTYASDKADYIPAAGVTLIENVTDIFTVVSNAQNVTATISDTVVLATKKDIQEHNESMGSHQDIRISLTDHKQKTTDHNIPSQISTAINEHKGDVNAHDGFSRRIEHVQAIAADIWSITHNLNTSKIPIVRAYAETAELITLSGYCGSGFYCGDGITCGSGSSVNVPVETDIAYSNLRLTSQNKFDIRFASPQAGKAVILI